MTTRTTARTPSTFVVGAGPVATALAGALRLGGVPVLGIFARQPAAARTAGSAAGVASFSSAPPDLLLEAEAVILAVRDEAISDVAQTLLSTGLITSRHVLLHCSGAMSAAEAFTKVRSQVGGVATLHPLRAIADARSALRSLRGTVFGIEGDEMGIAVAHDLTRAMGGTPLKLAGEQMAAYHTAAAMASNYVVTLIDAAAEVLIRAGLSEADALAALVPLAQGSLHNVAERGVAAGLTGPIRRGDKATVERHLSVLSGDGAALYRALGRRAVAIARRSEDSDQARLDAVGSLLGTDDAARGPTNPSM